MDFELTSHLDTTAQELWRAYTLAEQRSLRKQALIILRDFITAIKFPSLHQQYAFAEKLCILIVDQEQRIIIRFPVFEEIICPFLVHLHQTQAPNASRWIAHFTEWFNRSEKCREALGLSYISKLQMLRIAVSQNSNDTASKRELVEQLARWFDFTLHEVPWGVLYGMDGATIQECNEMIEELSYFEQLIIELGLQERHKERIEDCRYYYPAYIDYLSHKEEYNGFPDYLERHTR